MDRDRRAHAAASPCFGPDGALTSHRHDHGVKPRRLNPSVKLLRHLFRLQVHEVVGEEDPRLLLVADEAVGLHDEIPPLQGDAHVRHQRIGRDAVFFGVAEGLLGDLLVDVDLDDTAGRVLEDLVPVLLKQLQHGLHLGPLGDGAHHVALVVHHRQPDAHAVRNNRDKLGVHLVILQLAKHLICSVNARTIGM